MKTHIPAVKVSPFVVEKELQCLTYKLYNNITPKIITLKSEITRFGLGIEFVGTDSITLFLNCFLLFLIVFCLRTKLLSRFHEFDT